MTFRYAAAAAVVLILAGSLSYSSAKANTLVKINDDNWSQMLEGEWMVEFFAPWCPACRSLQPVWEDFSSWSSDLGIQIGQVDITSSPGLSGRFMITALPTIFHVKGGSFRQYKGPRTKEEFLSFVEEKKWEHLEPISSWQSPSSIQMTVVSQFYKISMGLRNVMNVMLDDYGIPSWAAYLVFGVATILVGLILGLLLVCIIDCIYPPSPPQLFTPPPSADGQKAKKTDEKTDKNLKDSDDEFTEEIQDDSQADTDGEEKEIEKEIAEEKSASTRRRKARKD